MRVALQRHPDTPSSAITGMEAEVLRQGPAILALHYFVHGDMANLLFPSPADPVRADNLWEHTCFEAFVRAPPYGGYYELNLSPSTEWAAYRLSAYRTGLSAAAASAPNIETRMNEADFELRASSELPGAATDYPWRLGLSAVIEEKNGNKSYWALAHPPGDPDFHHETCFALQLPAATAP